jgi:flagellin-like protein
LKNLKRSKRALSPVIASIILIAVTVAVSIAVAAWMGALVVNQMATEEAKITNVQFSGLTSATITVANTGSSPLTISEVYVGTTLITGASATSWTIQPGNQTTITVPSDYNAGTAYQFKLLSSKGNPFVFTATAPL